MGEADNIALYRRVVDEGVGVGNLEILDEALAPDIELPTLEDFAEPTLAGLRSANTQLRAGAPDARARITEIFSWGEWVAARLTWTGTHTGELFGMPPTGKSFSVTELEIVRCRDGRIVDLRQLIDMGELVAQLSG